MTILIKGMDMPECEKIMVVYPDGCTKIYMRSDMAEVPPHGQLIDADALITTFCEWGTRLECRRKLFITMCEAKQAIVDIIEDAPTVIEAEGE